MNSLRGKGLAILAIYGAKTMKPAREGIKNVGLVASMKIFS
jgi:hypothetical protein